MGIKTYFFEYFLTLFFNKMILDFRALRAAPVLRQVFEQCTGVYAAILVARFRYIFVAAPTTDIAWSNRFGLRHYRPLDFHHGRRRLFLAGIQMGALPFLLTATMVDASLIPFRC